MFFILSAMPVAILLVLAPQTFIWFWPGSGSLARGGFLFVLLFLGYELVNFRKAPCVRLSRNRKLAIGVVVMIGLCYFAAIALFKPLTNFIYQIGAPGFSVRCDGVSWLMATEYMALTVYLFGLATAFFGLRAIREIITGFVLSVGMMYSLLIAAFPSYGPLGSGPLQAWANFIVAAVSFLMQGLGFPVFGVGTSLIIYGAHGTWRLSFFWPSVGVEGILIFSLVMIVLVAKLSAPVMRKYIYAAVGAASIVFLNVVRISIISYYVCCCATSSEGLDAFSNTITGHTIGQFLYPMWIIAYLYIVPKIEKRLRANATNRLLNIEAGLSAAGVKLSDADKFVRHIEVQTPAGPNLRTDSSSIDSSGVGLRQRKQISRSAEN